MSCSSFVFLVEHIHCQICLFRNRWAHLLARKHEPPCLTDTDNMNISYWFCINIHKHCLIMQGASGMHHELFVWISSLLEFETALWLQQRPSVQSTRGDERPVWLLTLSGIVRYEKWHYYGYTVTMDPVRGVENTSGVHDIVSLTAWLCVCVELDGKNQTEARVVFFLLSLL